MITKPQNEIKEEMKNTVKGDRLKMVLDKTCAFAEKAKVDEILDSGVCENVIKKLKQSKQTLVSLKALLLDSMTRQVANTLAR